jgi:hypothetical protein
MSRNRHIRHKCHHGGSNKVTSVLDAITKLPRYIKVRSTNGIDENNAVVLEKEKEKKRAWYERNKEKEKEKKRAYYERNKPKLLQYYHDRYILKRKDILEQKKIYNQQSHVKQRNKEYHRQYYLEHKKNK